MSSSQNEEEKCKYNFNKIYEQNIFNFLYTHKFRELFKSKILKGK